MINRRGTGWAGPSAGAELRGAPASPPASRQRPSLAATGLIWTLIVFTVMPPTIFTYVPRAAPGTIGEAPPTTPLEGSAFSRTVWLVLLGLGAVLSLSRSGALLRLLRQVNPYLLGFFALVAASVVWSIEPGITIKRLVPALTITLDATALALAGWSYTRFQSVLRPPITALLLGSIVFVLMAPEMAIEQSSQVELVGAWHGLTAQKNSLGALAAIGFILWWHAWLSKESPSWIALFGAAVAAVCLVKSRSSTSIMATVFAALMMLMMLRSPAALRRYLPYLVGMFVVALLVYSLAVLKLVPGSDLLLSPITSITGKDQTFSGRTAIWQILNEHIALRPLLGSGYGAYWIEIPTSPSMQMLQRLYFYPTEGHNGYLDVINDLGIVGGACLFAYLIVFLRQGLRIFATLRTQGTLYLTLLFLQMVGNLSESRWFNILEFNFVIMTIATITMGRTLMDLQMRGQPATTGRAAGRTRRFSAR